MEAWVGAVQRGRLDEAWDLFLERYRRLLFSTIRRNVTEYDDVMDVFARVCEALRENDFARLRAAAARTQPDRPLSTLLVVVVHNLTIDWLRHRNGRIRPSTPALALPPLGQRIFEYVFVDGRSHVEAYEMLRAREGAGLSFGAFLRELTATYRAAAPVRDTGKRRPTVSNAPVNEAAAADHLVAAEHHDPAILAERRAVVSAALAGIPADDRLAVQLFVIDEMPAAQVAQALGYANAKMVYNRVHRALQTIRERLNAVGIEEGDL